MSNQKQLDKGAIITRYICWCARIQIKEKLENYAYIDEQQVNKGKTTK